MIKKASLLGASFLLALAPAAASAQMSALGATLGVSPAIVPDTTNVQIATVTLDSSLSDTDLSVSSIPLRANYSGGLSDDDFSNCRWTSGAATLATSGADAMIGEGATSLDLTDSITLTGGDTTPTVLTLTCDVLSSAPLGGTLVLSLDMAGGIGGPTSGILTVATADEVSSGTFTSVDSGSAGVGIPNTGAGASSGVNFVILALAILAVIGAIGYIVHARRID